MADTPIVHDIKFMTCKAGQLHMIMLDKAGNELADAVFHNCTIAAGFCEMFALNAAETFSLELSARSKEDTLQ